MTLIPGFKEGLYQMKEGGKAIFVIPASLAYGEEGAGASSAGIRFNFRSDIEKGRKTRS